MPVVPRTSDAGNGTEITSPNVAAKTVVGMVLGILCLFTLILTYQLIACPHRKRAAARRMPRNGLQAAKNTHTPSKTTRSFRNCSNLFGGSSTKPAPASNRTPGTSEKRAQPQDSKDGQRTWRALLLPFASPNSPTAPETPSLSQSKPTLLERKGLRALRLNTELLKSDGKQRYPTTPASPMMTPTRKRIGRVFEFASSPLNTPASSSSTLFSAGTPTPTGRHNYKKLDDKLYSDWSNQTTYPTERPPEAIVSPWSPNERQYPYAPYSPISVRWLSDTPRTPPPLYPPPPAYLPEVPVRSDGLGTASAPVTPTRPSRGASASTRTAPMTASPLAPPPPVSPIIRRLSEEIDGEIGSWHSDMPDIRAALASVVTLVDRQADRDDNVFVIADGSDSGEDGDDGASELDSVSLHTATDEYERMEPLSL
ncbi:hypothetical protein V8D89_005470 [Ganoderma adspersum]